MPRMIAGVLGSVSLVVVWGFPLVAMARPDPSRRGYDIVHDLLIGIDGGVCGSPASRREPTVGIGGTGRVWGLEQIGHGRVGGNAVVAVALGLGGQSGPSFAGGFRLDGQAGGVLNLGTERLVHGPFVRGGMIFEWRMTRPLRWLVVEVPAASVGYTFASAQVRVELAGQLALTAYRTLKLVDDDDGNVGQKDSASLATGGRGAVAAGPVHAEVIYTRFLSRSDAGSAVDHVEGQVCLTLHRIGACAHAGYVWSGPPWSWAEGSSLAETGSIAWGVLLGYGSRGTRRRRGR